MPNPYETDTTGGAEKPPGPGGTMRVEPGAVVGEPVLALAGTDQQGPAAAAGNAGLGQNGHSVPTNTEKQLADDPGICCVNAMVRCPCAMAVLIFALAMVPVVFTIGVLGREGPAIFGNSNKTFAKRFRTSTEDTGFICHI